MEAQWKGGKAGYVMAWSIPAPNSCGHTNYGCGNDGCSPTDGAAAVVTTPKQKRSYRVASNPADRAVRGSFHEDDTDPRTGSRSDCR
ncbi:hypothetical protein V5799_020064 [Amblyomma americanum]|uniref:Uncharacterized protein n=1 Tax=Amblyomma americanum TaxID=6943 RepID=A0AAQ4EVI1_AMBAM